jgi:hypothetical protein
MTQMRERQHSTESDVIIRIARVDFTCELYMGDSVEGL